MRYLGFSNIIQMNKSEKLHSVTITWNINEEINVKSPRKWKLKVEYSNFLAGNGT